MEPRLLDSTEAAAFIGVAPATMKHWRYSGTGPQYLRLGHKTIRYKEVDLRIWMEISRVTPEEAKA